MNERLLSFIGNPLDYPLGMRPYVVKPCGAVVRSVTGAFGIQRNVVVRRG